MLSKIIFYTSTKRTGQEALSRTYKNVIKHNNLFIILFYQSSLHKHASSFIRHNIHNNTEQNIQTGCTVQLKNALQLCMYVYLRAPPLCHQFFGRY